MKPFFRITCKSCDSLLTFYQEDIHPGLEMFKGKVFCFICPHCGKSLCVKENPFTQT